MIARKDINSMAWAVAREWSALGAYAASRGLSSDAYERAEAVIARWPSAFGAAS